jgi:hypothetical protein
MQVEQRVQFDGGLVPAKASPREQREAKVNRGGVQGVEAGIQIDSKIGSPAYIGRAAAIRTCAKSAKIRQSRDSFASAKVERDTLPRNPM